jgi:hypothetical protein
MRAAATPFAAGAGQKVDASRNLDAQIVDQSLRPMQERKNTAFAAVDPDRTVVRDAAPLVDAAKAVRDSPVIALNDSGIHTLSPQALPKDQDQTFSNDQIRIDDKVVWDANKHPLQVDWLPGFANDWLNGLIANARINLHRMNSGTSADKVEAARQMMARMFSVAPTVLFVLLPFFALQLKIFYIFKKRLYMEHLIVAMHSHAFLMLSTLVLVLLMLLRHWLNAYAGWLAIPVNLAEAAAWIWIFVYLFLMQKRVYRQGWIMTTVKYWCVGWCYSILVVFGLIFAALASLTST